MAFFRVTYSRRLTVFLSLALSHSFSSSHFSHFFLHTTSNREGRSQNMYVMVRGYLLFSASLARCFWCWNFPKHVTHIDLATKTDQGVVRCRLVSFFLGWGFYKNNFTLTFSSFSFLCEHVGVLLWILWLFFSSNWNKTLHLWRAYKAWEFKLPLAKFKTQLRLHNHRWIH